MDLRPYLTQDRDWWGWGKASCEQGCGLSSSIKDGEFLD